MGSIDLAGMMNPLPANAFDDRAIVFAQMQLGLAHSYTSDHQVAMSGVYSCSVIYVSPY
jgi:hypothetical protein